VGVNDNKALAVRFFEALDTGDIGLLQNIFTEDCVFHRGDLIAPARGLAGIVRLSKSVFKSTATSERQYIT
jgi:ketosteroid isomerase-like protein